MNNPRPITDLFATISVSASLVSWQVQLDWGLRVLASLVAFVAGSIAIWQWWKKGRAKHAGADGSS